MDRFFVGLTLCVCLCLAPIRCAREDVRVDVRENVEASERAFFTVLYPQFAGFEDAQDQDVEWYSSLLSFLRGEAA